MACAVAEICGPNGAIRFLEPDRVRELVAQHLAAHPHAYLFRWVERFPVAEHPWRWDCGRQVVDELYPKLLPGKATLPDVYSAFDAAPLAHAS